MEDIPNDVRALNAMDWIGSWIELETERVQSYAARGRRGLASRRRRSFRRTASHVCSRTYVPTMPTNTRQGRQADRFSGLIADADRVLGPEPLSPAQVQPLGSWANDAVVRASSVEHFVEEQAIVVDAAAWKSHLKGTLRLEGVIQHGAITRRSVVGVAHESARAGQWTPLLHASYAWGQGKNGYGPSRLTRIKEEADRAGVDIEATLSDAVERMQVGTAVDGYGRLQKAIPWLGPAFYTKFLYFAGAVAPPAEGPGPLILDAVVAAQVQGFVAARFAANESDPRKVRLAKPLAAWLWSSAGWSAYRYGIWLEFADAATTQLRTAIPTWSPKADAFELAVFSKQLKP